PEVPDEAITIQERILAMGFKWADGAESVQKVNESVQKGLLLDHGKLYYHPSKSDKNTLCTVHQLDEDYLSPSDRRMQDMFNALMARMDDLQAQMDRIEARVSPANLDKPSRKFPAPKNGGG